MDRETKALIHEIAREAAGQAVKQVLTALGIDHNNPIEMQKDLAALRELRNLMDDPEFQQDMIYIRRLRKAMDAVQNKGLIATIGLVIAGIGAVLLLGIKSLNS